MSTAIAKAVINILAGMLCQHAATLDYAAIDYQSDDISNSISNGLAGRHKLEFRISKLLFWFYFTGQALAAAVTVYFWPQSSFIWVIAITAYLALAVMIIRYGSALAKLHNSYYAFTMIGIYLNWIVFGYLGSFASFLIVET